MRHPIKRSIAVEQWNQTKKYGQGRNAEELNRYIESIRVKLYQIHRELEEKGTLITAERIKNIYEGKEETQKKLCCNCSPNTMLSAKLFHEPSQPKAIRIRLTLSESSFANKLDNSAI